MNYDQANHVARRAIDTLFNSIPEKLDKIAKEYPEYAETIVSQYRDRFNSIFEAFHENQPKGAFLPADVLYEHAASTLELLTTLEADISSFESEIQPHEIP